ncbi:RNA polymerase sigma factor, sigma-70 family [Abditibacterium utsteinense]|uniref:RNA polymerase sigma factor, sigma-70 family n=1 Tax=Abditibacterium utsteinense TaxID=1960156 RepID=A0A2S8SR80_9BACT|nr:sigma-70 family RNA polymerase sigma factor [Abditibacterium utsteinense]PQV63300.1 RNA polymerase sigma factor, sigma-70 family [Abditibacterium utsteinense]
MSVQSCPDVSLEDWIRRAQNGDAAAVEFLLEQFRPLRRARTHALWTAACENLSSFEWADVEAEVVLLFLSRLQSFRFEEGVYFPHYIERMLYFDGLSWLRGQRRDAAVPFSQLAVSGSTRTGNESSEDIEEWLFPGADNLARDVEQTLSLRDALDALPAAQKHLVWQCCVLSRTEADVARELGWSRSTVRNRLEVALSQLRDYFGVETNTGTRTGRISSRDTSGRNTFQHNTFQRNALQSEFWSFILIMAKDEKRPDLVGVGSGRPVLLQGTFDFPATGIKTPQLLSTKLRYVVPPGTIAGIRFVRAGIMCEKMVCVSTVVNGMPHRLICVAANTAVHVPLAIVEALPAGSEVEIHIASDAPGTAIIDVGCLQMPA